MRWQAENGEVGETFRVGGPESHGKHYGVWPNYSEAGAALSSHCIFLHCRDWKVKLHFPESLAAKWPRCCQSEEAKWDVGGKVLESEDLEGRGHAFALSASKHHPRNWLIFHQEVLVYPCHVSGSMALTHSRFGGQFHDCTKGECSPGGLLCSEALQATPKSSSWSLFLHLSNKFHKPFNTL